MPAVRDTTTGRELYKADGSTFERLWLPMVVALTRPALIICTVP